MISSTIEMACHRNGTQHFINADPTDIVLTPRSEQIVDGTKKFISEAPRTSQQFKVIWPGENGILRNIGPDGGVRRFDFILVGLHTATVEIGDTWENDDGQIFVVEYRFPDNGYEIKVGGVTHGSRPAGGSISQVEPPPDVVVPAPTADFDFHEAGGTVATDVMGNYNWLTSAGSSFDGPNAVNRFDGTGFTLGNNYTVVADIYLDLLAQPPTDGPFWLYPLYGGGIYLHGNVRAEHAGPHFYLPSYGDLAAPDGTWQEDNEYQVAYFCNATTGEFGIYNNGVLVASAVSSLPPTSFFTDVRVCDSGFSGHGLTGNLLRRLRIWHEPLSAEQIAELT